MQGKKEVRDVSTVPSDRRKTSERNNEKNMSAGYSGNGAVSAAVG